MLVAASFIAMQFVQRWFVPFVVCVHLQSTYRRASGSLSQGRMSSAQSGEVCQINVPSAAVGAIIGSGGTNIKQIIRDSGAFVIVSCCLAGRFTLYCCLHERAESLASVATVCLLFLYSGNIYELLPINNHKTVHCCFILP